MLRNPNCLSFINYFILFLFIFYLKIHPKVGVKYNRTLSPLQGIYTQKPDPSKLEHPT